MEVGIRELRADLSRLVKRVRAGDEILVTDRGKPVARLVGAAETKLDRLIAEGIVEPAPRTSPRRRPKPVKTKGTVSDLLLEERR